MVTELQRQMPPSWLPLLVQYFPDLLWLKDPAGFYLMCNHAFEAFFGVSEQTVIGKTDGDFVVQDGADTPVPTLLLHQAAVTGQSSQEWWVAADGRRVLFDVVQVPLRLADGQVVGVFGTARDVTREYAGKQALRASEDRFRAIFEGSGALAIQGYAPDGTVLYWNPASEALYGYRAEEALGRKLFELIIPPAARELVVSEVAQMFRLRQAVPAARLDLQHKDGHLVPVYSSHAMVESAQAGLTLFCLDIDLSSLVQAENARRDSERRYRTLFDATGDGIFVLRGQVVVDCNRAAAEHFHCDRTWLIGRSLTDLSPAVQEGEVLTAQLLAFYFMAETCAGTQRIEWCHVRADGGVFEAEWHVTAVDIAGEPHHLVSFHDITERKKSAQLIWQQANFDLLTALPNRNFFQDGLAQAIRATARTGGQLALMFIDLDNFRQVNDTLGHRVGDLLLRSAARRLQECVRSTDVVARLGGDEFAVVLRDMHELPSLERVVQQVLQRLAAPFYLADEPAYVSASIGITVYPDDADNPDVLQNNADQAMFAAKRLGRNRFCYFTSSMQAQAQAHASLCNDLRNPAAAEQFHLMYQPVVDLRSGQLVKAEALLRWMHPTRGLIKPSEFIPVSEDTGLVVDIGNWVFREAVGHVKRWREAYSFDLQISINVSPVQFYSDGENISAWLSYLESLPLGCAGVALEITERLLLESTDMVTAQLDRFRAAGVQVLLDDFGTGYSSLSYLKQFHLDYLKIDRSFITNLEQGENDLALCEAIIVMAHRLGMKVVAEGVETEGQRQRLIAAGCDYAQGFLFSPPLDGMAFERLLQQLQPGGFLLLPSPAGSDGVLG